MDAPHADYDPRYLAGILLFNRADYFEAHEVWEDLWMNATGTERRFYQGLIQAAVGLLHFGNGNVRGAVKLYHSSRDYMRELGSVFLGMNVPEFWTAMGRCFEPLLTDPPAQSPVELQMDMVPIIQLDPAPAEWPDPDKFVAESQD
jgi:hypothetical protein